MSIQWGPCSNAWSKTFICFLTVLNFIASYQYKESTKTNKWKTTNYLPDYYWGRRQVSCFFRWSRDHSPVELPSSRLSQMCEPMGDLHKELLRQPVKDSWWHVPETLPPLIWLLLLTKMRNVLMAWIPWPCKRSQTGQQSDPVPLDLKLSVSSMLGIFYPWSSLSLFLPSSHPLVSNPVFSIYVHREVYTHEIPRA